MSSVSSSSSVSGVSFYCKFLFAYRSSFWFSTILFSTRAANICIKNQKNSSKCVTIENAENCHLIAPRRKSFSKIHTQHPTAAPYTSKEIFEHPQNKNGGSAFFKEAPFNNQNRKSKPPGRISDSKRYIHTRATGHSRTRNHSSNIVFYERF